MDFLICLLLLAMGMGALYSKTLYGSLTLFFAFGLIMALAWARLQVPGLAMAEAIIGAGLSGALMYNALNKSPPEVVGPERPHHRIAAGLLALAVLGVVAYSYLPGLERVSVLPAMVRQGVEVSGLGHPVTAVVKNFRTWDTFLEITVLLLAVLGVKVLRPTHTPTPQPWPALSSWGRTLAPIALLTGGYLLWRGEHGAGGAFQAAAVIAAGAVMLRLIQVLPALRWSRIAVRAALLFSGLVYVALGATTAWLGEGFLNVPHAYVGAVTLVLEISLTLSLATALTLLVAGEGEELQS
jgi:multisubunit Na+/H+ antiporter MnhB subunit